MGESGTRGTTERVPVGNSPPTVARAALLPDGDGSAASARPSLPLPAAPDAWRSAPQDDMVTSELRRGGGKTVGQLREAEDSSMRLRRVGISSPSL